MIQLWPSQYRPFVRRVIRYALLLALLQMMGILVVAALVPSPPGSGIVGFNWLFTLWILWLLQLAAGVILGWLLFKLVVRVVCPNCLARLSFRRRHQRYYCRKCDEYFDDGTMVWLARISPPPPRPLSE
jgi:hypothetical protein